MRLRQEATVGGGKPHGNPARAIRRFKSSG